MSIRNYKKTKHLNQAVLDFSAILKFAPDVASLEMLCHSVNDKLKYGRPHPGELIGAGAQENVFTCTNILTPEGKPCVVKVVPVSSETLLKDLTLELHTTRYVYLHKSKSLVFV